MKFEGKPPAWQGLVKLQEECCELGVELAKLSAYPEGEHPDGRGVCVVRVLDEMADVIAAIQWFCERHGLAIDWSRVDRKNVLYSEWDSSSGMSGRAIVVKRKAEHEVGSTEKPGEPGPVV